MPKIMLAKKTGSKPVFARKVRISFLKKVRRRASQAISEKYATRIIAAFALLSKRIFVKKYEIASVMPALNATAERNRIIPPDPQEPAMRKNKAYCADKKQTD